VNAWQKAVVNEEALNDMGFEKLEAYCMQMMWGRGMLP
jgi:hypothetical protein